MSRFVTVISNSSFPKPDTCAFRVGKFAFARGPDLNLKASTSITSSATIAADLKSVEILIFIEHLELL